MKIVMLGHTGVGKTTYMASLYGVMQQDITGFRLKAVDNQEHTRWLSLAEAIRQGKYPMATDQRNDYEFYLKYQGQKVLSFFCADYRGGALRETQESEQAQKLYQDLKTADGILLFCDSEALLMGKRSINQIGRMIALVNNALQNLAQPLSLGIILTKVDLVPEFTEQLLTPFESLVTAVNNSHLITGSFIPIVCGTKLLNIPLPLLFVLHTTITSQAQTFYQSYEDLNGAAINYEKESLSWKAAFTEIFDQACGEPTKKQLAKEKQQLAEKNLRDYELIRQPAESLKAYLRSLPIINKDYDIDYYFQTLKKLKTETTNQVLKNVDPFYIFD
ncbi:MAG: hypothetical protein EA365_08880 [Gloeocapsa sp. DLM2.Bin57]|nr:MAG: hypothetical protein EA365_08880 [Gloeocapsa sp. DLM2.Bin57]